MKALPHLYISNTDKKGRGVFTGLDIEVGSLIEICPLILIPAEQTKLIDQTFLYNYYFVWNTDHIAIALGYGSLYNHNTNPNAKVTYDFESEEIQIEAIQTIKAGEEIFINYVDHDNPEYELWFEEK